MYVFLLIFGEGIEMVDLGLKALIRVIVRLVFADN